jgi:hypothetical protein
LNKEVIFWLNTVETVGKYCGNVPIVRAGPSAACLADYRYFFQPRTFSGFEKHLFLFVFWSLQVGKALFSDRLVNAQFCEK